MFYKRHDSVLEALKLHGTQENDFTWYVAYCEKMDERQYKIQEQKYERSKNFSNRNLVVKGLSGENLHENYLRETFKDYGDIESIFIREKLGYVCFKTEEQAKNAQSQSKNLMIDGVKIDVLY